MMHAKDWSVPMLVIHSDKDYRIPLSQGVGAFTACQAKGINSEFLRFPIKPLGAEAAELHDVAQHGV